MPPHQQMGLLADLSGLSLDELCSSDSAYNVELAWLAFNWRVLSMAAVTQSTPLFEKLQFLAISSSNLDEFFAKRVGGLMRHVAAGASNLTVCAKDRQPSEQQLIMIAEEVRSMVAMQTESLRTHLLPELRAHGVRILSYADLSTSGAYGLNQYFGRELELLLTPIKLDPAHPFPFLPSLSLNLIVTLEDPHVRNGPLSHGSPGDELYAIVNIPSSFSRWCEVPVSAAPLGDSWQQAFIPVEQIIEHNLDQLFGGAVIKEVHTFRVTRNADLERQEEGAEDLLDMIAGEVRERRFAPFVRLEVPHDMPAALTKLLTEELNLDRSQNVSQIDSLLDLADLASLPVNKRKLEKELLWQSWKPREHGRLDTPHRRKRLRKRLRWAHNTGSWATKLTSIFSVIRCGDVLLQHPYHDFASSTQRLVEEAAVDPRVAAIKVTLYRTSSDSPIITALLKAADHGKQVTVVVELKARFDEARNLGFAQRLEDAGCNVAWGLLGSKTHCKLMLVVRREGEANHGLRTYVHIGTGNYNPKTAGSYSDFGLLSCEPAVCNDVNDVFKLLTGMHDQAAVGGYRKLLVAREFMRDQFGHLIDREAVAAASGKPAAICIKVNALDDKQLVRKLYEAAAQGVRVDAIVRGACRLRAGVEGVSETVRVVSVVGRFLEHHRVYSFLNGGDPLFFIGSADWMSRNLSKRVEVAVPVTDPALKQQLRDVLALCLCDGVDAWDMLPDGRYVKPATRLQEAPLSLPLLEVSTAYLQKMQDLGSRLGCQAATMQQTKETLKQPSKRYV